MPNPRIITGLDAARQYRYRVGKREGRYWPLYYGDMLCAWYRTWWHAWRIARAMNRVRIPEARND